ncbi:3-hydroxyacyl-ACP dehydratase FabZ [Peptoniphilus sp. KCTC 25270]|uniref:3-hydroxyacyl-ACP dehydratase FabZ n=1 Tax=Peptoniphilus sp. KCTC 25270 TaxID=2897414 RepID=UPI001E50DFFA|nr:3-hydroxyacyl-ACP dehydratase FabZ [Peptoniphilus sp. KCTC 25270]MCD1147705.1 3-hydroxyacyl-ACP dehydratase FabZ [Peptoniphilus sp. KCTC 25270]
MTLNIEEIQEILPHRYPFLMVDRILSVEKGEKAEGIKCVSGNEPYFQGHFPEKKVMPGVLQVEAVAQVGAVALLMEETGKIAYLGGIKKARFYKEVVPGDLLEIKCSIIKHKGNIGFGEGEIFVAGEKVMSCEISFAIA